MEHVKNKASTYVCEICRRTQNEITVSMCKKYGGTLCGKHRRQFLLYGRFLERTMYDNNEYIIHDNYAEIVLRDAKQNIVGYAKIDIEDIEKCKKHKWGMRKNRGSDTLNYAFSHIDNNKLLHLHRYVLNYDGDQCVDHINRDSLDNRKKNLRIVSTTINNLNTKRIGACKKDNKYISYFKANGIIYRLDSFSTKEEAHKNTQIEKQKYIDDPINYIKEYNEKIKNKKEMENIQKTRFNTWHVAITKNHVRYNIGNYKTLEEAKKARDGARKELELIA